MIPRKVLTRWAWQEELGRREKGREDPARVGPVSVQTVAYLLPSVSRAWLMLLPSLHGSISAKTVNYSMAPEIDRYVNK